MSAKMTSILCTLILNMTSMYIITSLLDRKLKLVSLRNLIIIVTLTSVQTIAYNYEYSILYTFVNYMLLVIANKIIFKENMCKIIVATYILLLILIIGDIINSIVMINFVTLSKIRSCWYLRIISNLFVSLYSIIISLVFNKKFKYFVKKFENRYIPVMYLFTVLIISIIFVIYGIAANFDFNISFITNILIIVALVSFFYIFINEDNEFHKLNDEYDSLFKCIQTFEEWIEREQLNRHEYKNQLASLRCISKEKKVKDKIDSIINDNININSSTVNQLKPIPNGGLKGLLYYKIVIAQNNKLNIELDISLKHPNLIKNISEVNMKIICRLVGIYMDNAIEAATTTNKKIICLEIYEIKKEINIVISNSFNKTDNFSKRYEKGYSTKGKGRGNGLYFAKKMANKCSWITEEQSTHDEFYIQKLIIKSESSIYKN